MLGYLSVDIICSVKPWGTDNFQGEIFEHVFAWIVFIIFQIFFATRAVLKIREYPQIFRNHCVYDSQKPWMRVLWRVLVQGRQQSFRKILHPFKYDGRGVIGINENFIEQLFAMFTCRDGKDSELNVFSLAFRPIRMPSSYIHLRKLY